MHFCIKSGIQSMEPTKVLLLFHSILSLVVSVTGGGTSPAADTCSFSYNSFPTSNDDAPYLKFSGDGKLSRGAVEISIDTANTKAKTASWGWVVESRKLQFKQSRSRDVNSHTVAADTSASFSTTFNINLQVSKNNGRVGGGVAFMLTPQNMPDPSRTGQWLGLYDQSSNGRRSNNIVAIEFDTYKDEFDPDNNHVGLDLNDIRSFSTQPLVKYGINLSDSSSIFTFRIEYNGPRKLLDVFMARADVSATSNKNDAKNVLHVTDINLGNYTSDVVYAGFAASSGDAVDLHCLLSWNFSMECFLTPTNNHLGTIEISLIIATAAAVLIGIIAITLLIRRRNQKRKVIDSRLTRMELDRLHSSGPRRFSYRELSKATGNFSKSNKLGSGASGTVYRATLYDKTVVSVKRISCEGVKEFVSEGSLDRWLFTPTPVESQASPIILNWAQRYKVLCRTASALVYLHEGLEQTVIHRDVKAINIMLDSDFTPRLGDFGLARVTEHGLSQLETVNMGGTPGYIPPEMLDTWMVTKQADVYSFGILVLEVVCGRRPIYMEIEQSKFLLEWVWELYEGGKLAEAVDSQLERGSYNKEEMERVLKAGLLCANPNMIDRPPMSLVLQELTSKGPSTLNLPSCKPKYYRPHFPTSSPTLPRSPPPPSVISKSREDANSASISASYGSTSIVQQDQLSELIPR